MSAYNRYLFCKKMYPDYLVIVVVKGKLVTFGYDLKILEKYGFDNISKMNIYYIILDGLEIKLSNIGKNNYFYYFEICLLKDVLNYIKTKDSILKVKNNAKF